jgi:single-stranded DNA-binding protein
LNNSTLCVTIVQPPELRYPSNNSTIAEFTVSFPNIKTPEQPAVVKAIAWGKLAENICEQDLQVGDRLVLESRVSIVVSEEDGIKHKKAELTVQRYFLVSGEITAPGQGAIVPQAMAQVAPTKTPVTPVSKLATPKAKAAPVAAAVAEELAMDYDSIPF